MKCFLCSIFFLLLCSPCLSVQYPIDVVYTWVDGSDKHWQEDLGAFIAHQGLDRFLMHDSLSKKRFRDHDELKYSLRSLEAHAPWVHHIYIVTADQIPSWIQEHPKITFISHKQIFTEAADLPSFNSMAIEANLHRIPGLSEHYIYFNDDVFLGQDVYPSDFFTMDDKVCVFFSRHSFQDQTPKLNEIGFKAACKNTFNLLNSVYGKKDRLTHGHTPFPAKKSLVNKIEEFYPDIFAAVSSHHFRSIHDYTITNGLIPFIALENKWASGFFENGLVVHVARDLEKDRRALRFIQNTHPKFFCIQDGGENETPEMILQIRSFFEESFPNKAEWEEEPTQENPSITENDTPPSIQLPPSIPDRANLSSTDDLSFKNAPQKEVHTGFEEALSPLGQLETPQKGRLK